MKFNVWCRGALSVFLLLLLTGCGMSDSTIKYAQTVEKNLQEVTEKINDGAASYQKAKTSDKFQFYAPYAKRENWDQYFEEAKVELVHAQKIWKEKVAPILERNKSKEEAILQQHLKRVQTSYKAAFNNARQAQARMTELDRYRKEAPQLVAKAQEEMKKIDEINKNLSSYATQVKSDYPSRKKDITAKYSPFLNQQRNAQAQLNIVEEELIKHKANMLTDYAKLGDGVKVVLEASAWTRKQEPLLRSKLEELYKSYTKILEDMKEDRKYWILLVKYEWSEYYDWDNTSVTRREKRFVPEDQYKKWVSHLQSRPDGVIYDSGYQYEIVVEDADYDSTYYHKYTLFENGNKEMTDWVRVDEDMYEDHSEDLGMEIVSKPYGYFEEEKLEEAAPPGMSLVGNEKYGQWRQDSSGNSFWHYYGIYSFLNGGPGGHRIYRDGYNDWNRNYRGRDSYYGKSKSGSRKYGTLGTVVRTSPKYSNTNVAKAGTLQTAPASVRGPGRRGGGPGSRGK